jgi:hypothetical protein
MPVKRLGTGSPPANTNLLLTTSDVTGVASVIVANRGAIPSQVSSHPFKIQVDTGGGFSDVTSGLVHVDPNGTISLDGNAQGKNSGTLYWNVPITSSDTYRYICSIHSAMVGTITHKSLSAI